jgi:hypothetical protein
MDRDGDPDVLINWHHHEPLEIFENVAGRFVQRNPLGADGSGVYDNRDVPYLFASVEEMIARIAGSNRDGLYVWHDRQRGGSWRLFWRNVADAYGGLKLRLETSLPVLEVTGLRTGEFTRPGPRHVVVTIDDAANRRAFALRVRRVATQLRIHVAPARSGSTPTLYAGRDVIPLEGDGVLELSVASHSSPNLLLALEESSARLRNRAGQLGLDRNGAAAQTWGDLDRNGLQDLFFLDGNRIHVLRHSGSGFELVSGDELGLTLPDLPPPPGAIDPTALRLADFDNDGDLDPWILAHGREGASFLFRRDERGVRWRGQAGETRYPLRETGRRIVLER